MKKLVVFAIVVLGIKRLATMCSHVAAMERDGRWARHDAHSRFRGKVSV